MIAAIDWQGIATVIAAIGAAMAAIIGALNRRSIQTPSGTAIGKVAELTHDNAAVSASASAAIIRNQGLSKEANDILNGAPLDPRSGHVFNDDEATL